MKDDGNDSQATTEAEAEAEYLLQMELFQIEQAFLDAAFDDCGNEVEPE